MDYRIIKSCYALDFGLIIQNSFKGSFQLIYTPLISKELCVSLTSAWVLCYSNVRFLSKIFFSKLFNGGKKYLISCCPIVKSQGRIFYRSPRNHFDYTWKIPSLKMKALFNLETFCICIRLMY